MMQNKNNKMRNTSDVVLDKSILRDIIGFIKKNNLSSEQINKIFSKSICEWLNAREKNLPLSIFNNVSLSALEAVVKYLKENQNLKLKEIAGLLNRNSKTIWTTYNNASKKMPETFETMTSSFFMPLELFKDRDTSPLEVVVIYMKDELGFKNHEIAKHLNRNQRTIWTTYNRKRKK